MAQDVKVVAIPFPDPGASDTFSILKAPVAQNGGGLRLLGAYMNNAAATSGTVSYTVALHKYSNAGTPAVNGTISAAIGGTAAHWADNVPKAFTIDNDYAFVAAGESVYAVYTEQNEGNPTRAQLYLHYVNGK